MAGSDDLDRQATQDAQSVPKVGPQPATSERTEYRLMGVLYMISAGLIAYAAYSTFSNFAGSISTVLANCGFSIRQADAISDAIVFGSISAVMTTFALAWSYRTFKGGFFRFLYDNEPWLDRFANGGDRGRDDG